MKRSVARLWLLLAFVAAFGLVPAHWLPAPIPVAEAAPFFTGPAPAGFVNAKAYGATGNGSTDDTAALQVALNALAGSGQTLFIPAGTYLVSQPLTISSQTQIWMEPDAVKFHSTISPSGGGGFTASLFYAPRSNLSATTTLTADALIGANTLALTSVSTPPIGVGSDLVWCISASGNVCQTATVIAKSGNTVTLDEEIVSQYFTVAASTTVATYTAPKNIRIWGNGAKIWGTGDRAFEAVGGRWIYVDGLIVDQTLGTTGSAGFGAIVMSFDIGCRDVGFSNCRADGGAGYETAPTATAGFAVEATNRWYMMNTEALNFSAGLGGGYAILDGRQGTMSGTAARGSLIGFYFGSNDAFGTEGSRENTILGPSSSGNAIGYQFDKGSETFVYGPSSVGDAVSVSMIGTGFTDFRDVNAKARPSGAYNFFSAIGTGGHLFLSGTLDLSTGAGTTTICDWSFGGGTLHLWNFLTKGGTFGLFIENAAATAGAAVDFGPGVNIASTGNGHIAGPGTAKLSASTVTCNGVTPVAVAWPLIASTSTVNLTRKTAGGTPCTGVPTYTISEGTGFSVTCSTAACNDVLSYSILN